MKRVAFGCLYALGGWLLSAVAIVLGLRYGYGLGFPQTLGIAAMAGLLAWIALALLFAALRSLREWWALRAALAGRVPVDGAGAVIVGTLQAQGELLQAPFDAGECIAYHYRVIHDSGAGQRHRTISTLFDGVGLAPCTIASAAGYFRLLTVPELDAESTASGAVGEAAVQDYVRTTTFLDRRQAADELLQRWDDADGSYRSDVGRIAPQDVDWARCSYALHVLRAHMQVCVFGYFCAERRALVPPPAWAGATRIYRGSGEQIAVRLRKSAWFRLCLGLAVGAGAGALLFAFISHHV